MHIEGLGKASAMRDRNAGEAEPFDAHVVIRYSDVIIYAATWKKRKGAPDAWWDNEALVFNAKSRD